MGEIVNKKTHNDQGEFNNAFDVLAFEGRRWQVGAAIVSSIFSLVITVPISFVTLIIEGIFFDLPNHLTKLTRLYPGNSVVQIIEYASLKIIPTVIDGSVGWRFDAYIVLLSSILTMMKS